MLSQTCDVGTTHTSYLSYLFDRLNVPNHYYTANYNSVVVTCNSYSSGKDGLHGLCLRGRLPQHLHLPSVFPTTTRRLIRFRLNCFSLWTITKEKAQVDFLTTTFKILSHLQLVKKRHLLARVVQNVTGSNPAVRTDFSLTTVNFLNHQRLFHATGLHVGRLRRCSTEWISSLRVT